MLQDLKIYVPTGCGNFPVLCEILGVYSFKNVTAGHDYSPIKMPKRVLYISIKLQVKGTPRARWIGGFGFRKLQENHVGTPKSHSFSSISGITKWLWPMAIAVYIPMGGLTRAIPKMDSDCPEGWATGKSTQVETIHKMCYWFRCFNPLEIWQQL